MRVAAFVLMLAMACAQAAHANLLSNGSFELAQQSGPTRVSMTNLQDWTNSGGFNLLEQGPNGTSSIAAQDGTQFVSMGHNGTSGSRVEQTFATTAGLAYDVSLWTRPIQGGATPPLQVLQVILEGASTIANPEFDITDPTQWTQHQFQFTATGATTTIALSDVVGAGANIAVDNVSVTLVPEPATAACLAMGLGAIVARRRR